MSYKGFKARREASATNRMMKNAVSNPLGAMSGGGGSGISYGAPNFYSPIHTPTSWTLPTKRREVALWCRFFAANEPKVAAALDVYSDLSVTEFDNVCEDELITSYYDDLCRRLNINGILERIVYEYFCIGDAYVFASIACEKCGGSGVVAGSERKDGSYIPCGHDGGTFHSITLLNNDWVEVTSHSITNEELIYLIPGNDLKNIVQRQQPKEIYDRIPDIVKQAVMIGKPILLNPLCTTHLAQKPTGTNPYGTSIISRLFRTLAYKDKIIQAQWIVADRHILPTRIVKIGNDNIPATDMDIQIMHQQLLQMSQDPTVTLVTNHTVEYDYQGASGKVMQLGKEYDMIEQEILDGLMINKALLNGEGPNFSSASVGLEAFIKRLDSVRKKLKHFIEEKIYRPVAMMQGFTTKNERNEEVLFYPKVRFKEMKLRDDTQQKNFLMQMAKEQYISKRTLLEYSNIDYDIEIGRIRMENIEQKEYNLGGEDEGGMGGGGLGGMLDLGGGGGGGGAPDMDMGGGDVPMPDMGGGEPEASMPNVPAYPVLKRPIITRKIQKEKKLTEKKLTEKEIEQLKPNRISLNGPEQKIFIALEELQKQGKINQPFIPQYKPCRERKFILDFAFPKIKLGIEVDGPLHDTPEKINTDKEKDAYLFQKGWKIHRFKEKEINKELETTVVKALENLINERIKSLMPPS